MGAEAKGGVGSYNSAASTEELKHDGADVYGNDFDAKVCGEESAREATVAVAQD
jgi:hypothetical protein